MLTDVLKPNPRPAAKSEDRKNSNMPSGDDPGSGWVPIQDPEVETTKAMTPDSAHVPESIRPGRTST